MKKRPMHQSIPAAPSSPSSPGADPHALAFFGGWRTLSCQILRGRDENRARANAPSSINNATFFIDRTVG